MEDRPTPTITPSLVGRGFVAGIAIAIVSLAFIASYAGALHEPTAHDVPIAVTRQVPAELAARLDGSPELAVDVVADDAAARRAIDVRDDYGALTATPGGLRLTVAPAASASIAQLLQQTIPQQLRSAGQRVDVATVHPLPAADSRGLVSFYTVVGWVIAGYLGATLFGLMFGTQVGRARTALRLGALTATGLVIGLGGALLAKAIGDLPGPWLGLTLLGALVVVSVGVATVALQSLLGLAGTGVAILVFVIVGNPASGGPAAPELLPGFWRAVGQLIPVGAGFEGLRDAAYFPAASLAGPLLTLGIWLLAGAVVALALGGRGRRMTETEAEVAAAGAMAP
ncbi:MAG TPA: hypothetical protein VFR97_07800 [Capillimicrobium sp.]|nr:hypothetical protein [Capillimicrobium sp.]